MKLLDRYIVREILPPFFLALGVLTFLLATKPMLERAEMLLAKGTPIPTVGVLLLTLLPQALGVTIPMAFLTGVLMALGRLSGDREAVALLSCGVSPLRILRPVGLLAVLAGTINLYILTILVPDANQKFREITFSLLQQMGENDIRPGVFYEGFPNTVIYVRDETPEGWRGVLLADTSKPGPPALTLASEGYLAVDSANRRVSIVLPGESMRYIPGEDEVYDTVRSVDFRFDVEAETVFGSGEIIPSRGLNEMSIVDLRRAEADKVAAGLSPHPEIIARHQRFSFPAACLVFALIGVALGLHTRKEGRLGGFALGIGVIFVYYGVMQLADALTKGGLFPAEWTRWAPNIVVGIIGILALVRRMRHSASELTITLPAWTARLWKTKPTEPAAAAESGARSAQAAPIVLVIRFPELELPRLRLLDRYVSRRYVNVAFLSFFGLIGLYYIGTLIDKSERLFKGEATAGMLIDYFLYSTPQFIAYVAPMATLVAVLATVGSLMRTSELVVMRACGISIYRVGLPLIFFAVLWGGGLFMLDDRVLAHANRRAEALDDQIRGRASHNVNALSNRNWLADRQGRIYYYAAFDPSSSTLFNLSIFQPEPGGGRLANHTFVRQAEWIVEDGTWRSFDGREYTFRGEREATRTVFGTKPLDLAPPENFSGMHNQASDLMSYTELQQYVAEQRESGLNVTGSRVEMARRIAFPFVTIVMTLIGIPFGVTIGKRGALYGVGLALVLGTGYWLIDTFFVAIGQAGLLSPWLAAWAANLLFLAVAVYAVLTVRT
jgi:LPS export ABC transporter permease LptG/LPS export ABC transporter permease LptF